MKDEKIKDDKVLRLVFLIGLLASIISVIVGLLSPVTDVIYRGQIVFNSRAELSDFFSFWNSHPGIYSSNYDYENVGWHIESGVNGIPIIVDYDVVLPASVSFPYPHNYEYGVQSQVNKFICGALGLIGFPITIVIGIMGIVEMCADWHKKRQNAVC